MFYHSITTFVFNDHFREAKRSAFFHARTIATRRKARFRLRIRRILFAAKHSCATLRHEQTIIFRQLFAGHVVGFRPMKRKKNLQQMIIGFLGTENSQSQSKSVHQKQVDRTLEMDRMCHEPFNS